MPAAAGWHRWRKRRTPLAALAELGASTLASARVVVVVVVIVAVDLVRLRVWARALAAAGGYSSGADAVSAADVLAERCSAGLRAPRRGAPAPKAGTRGRLTAAGARARKRERLE